MNDNITKKKAFYCIAAFIAWFALYFLLKDVDGLKKIGRVIDFVIMVVWIPGGILFFALLVYDLIKWVKNKFC